AAQTAEIAKCKVEPPSQSNAMTSVKASRHRPIGDDTFTAISARLRFA
ncbi:hypothetical protein A2U01_0093456, partial [Trifolium medium]|nr:hypothetical protein [Trifolium medium]